jgi:hypothetical protein
MGLGCPVCKLLSGYPGGKDACDREDCPAIGSVPVSWEGFDRLWKDNEHLRAKIARLREALERCADVTEKWPDNLARQVNEIARAALAEQEKKH